MNPFAKYGEDEQPERKPEPPKNYIDVTEPSRQAEKMPNDEISDDEKWNEAATEEPADPVRRWQQKVKNGLGNRVLVIVLVIGFVLVFVLSQLWMKDATLRELVVVGNDVIKTEEVTGQFKDLIGKRMEDVKLSKIESAVGKMNYVGLVVVTKELPGTIRINIEERVPVALAWIGNDLRLIDNNGYVLDYERKALEDERFPMLSGFKKVRNLPNGARRLDSAEVHDAIELLKAVRQTEYARMVLSEVNVSSPSKMYALTSEGHTRFIFGNGGAYDRKLSYLETFWKEVVAKKGVNQFEYVDLRYEGKVFAK
ncbi:MAG: FtsQ-type POTRA domain-containing protein [Chlorobiales bacterium]|nr:FtsQ-type POTRA domain-containing protein [Chlorobiales bacterium]